jgi:hypothetical protein
MKTTVQINIVGIALEVEGEFTPEESDTWECPGLAATFDVESVRLVNQSDDIYHLIVSGISMEEIDNLAIEALSECDGD